MKVVALPRQLGKTTKMLQWMREAPEGEHRVLVCVSGREAMRLLRENPDLESWQLIGPDELGLGGGRGVLMGRGDRIVLGIDNLDLTLNLILSRWTHWPVGAISVTSQGD